MNSKGINITDNHLNSPKSPFNINDFLKLSIKESPFPQMVIADGGKVIAISQTFKKMTGYNLSEISNIKKWINQSIEGKNLSTLLKVIIDQKRICRKRIFPVTVKTRRGKTLHWDIYVSSKGNLINGRLFIIIVAKDITERKQNEIDYQTVEKNLKRAQKVGKIGSWELDIKKNALKWSDENYKIFGIPKANKNITYETFLQVVHPDDRKYVDESWNAALKGEPYDIEHRLLVKGKIKWVNERAFIETDKKGNVLGGFGITQDITRRKSLETQIQSTSLFPLQNPDPVFRICGKKHIILFANESCHPIFKSWKTKVGGKIPEHFRKVVMSAITDNALKKYEYVCQGKVFSFNVVPIKKIKYVNVYGRDITDLKLIETSLPENEEKLRSLYFSMTEGLALHEIIFNKRGKPVDYKIIDVNPSFEKITKIPANKAIGALGSELYERKKPPFLDIYSHVALSREAIDFETKYSPMQKSFFISAFSPSFGKFATVFTDITDRKRAEEVLRRDKEILEVLVQKRTEKLIKAEIELERNKRLSDIGMLAATVAHEMRNPLSAISIAAYNISQKVDKKKILKNLNCINSKVLESEKIISNLLLYSRLRPAEHKKIRIYDVLKECIQQASHQYPNKRKIDLNYIANLKNLWIEADRLQMKEFFSNVLNNAYDAITLTQGCIEIKSRIKKSSIEISIIDNGKGIPKNDQEQIFEPFFTTKVKGTGLGLALCSQIVEFHHGEIILKSKPKKGTTVKISLPKINPNPKKQKT